MTVITIEASGIQCMYGIDPYTPQKTFGKCMFTQIWACMVTLGEVT